MICFICSFSKKDVFVRFVFPFFFIISNSAAMHASLFFVDRRICIVYYSIIEKIEDIYEIKKNLQKKEHQLKKII